MKHTLVAWMRDRPGVLNRVSGMLRRRNFNIDSLQVGHSETPGISRMTFVVDGNDHMVNQVITQMRKVVDVTRVEDITNRPIVVRELALIRVQANAETRSDIVQMVNIYRGDIVDVAMDSMVVQIVGAEERIDSLIDLLTGFGIIEMVRTGRVALVRGSARRKRRRSIAVWRASVNGNEEEDTEESSLSEI
jgi:acetolactate synthase I/III small subunit